MSNFLFYLSAFVLVLGVLVVVHEYGHYKVARLCGVKVLRFSVGFGRPVWQKTFGVDRTVWAIGIFPLGGYVKMLDEREAPVATEEVHRAFNRRPVGQRIAIVAAGPFANFVLAFLIYWGVFWHGVEELRPIVGAPPAASAAAAAGFESGERVIKVGESSVETWEDVRWLLLQKAVDNSRVVMEVINERSEISVRYLDVSTIRDSGWESDAFERLGLTFYRPKIPPVIGKVLSGGVADRAGIRVGDRVISIDDEPTDAWARVVAVVRASAGKTLRFEILRDNTAIQLSVMPELHEEKGVRIGRIGVTAQDAGLPREALTVRVSHGVFGAFSKALRETWDKSVFSLVMLGKMVVGEVSWRNLSGPVTIADYAGQSAKLGLEYYLKFMALVSISLGVLNLLPIPILDGGHLLYYVVEIIKGGPVSEKVMEIGQQIGFALLLMLMAFAFYNDINRVFSG